MARTLAPITPVENRGAVGTATDPYGRYLRIRLLPWVLGVKANRRVRMHPFRPGQPAVNQSSLSLRRDPLLLPAPIQRMPPVPSEAFPKQPWTRASSPVPRGIGNGRCVHGGATCQAPAPVRASPPEDPASLLAVSPRPVCVSTAARWQNTPHFGRYPDFGKSSP